MLYPESKPVLTAQVTASQNLTLFLSSNGAWRKNRIWAELHSFKAHVSIQRGQGADTVRRHWPVPEWGSQTWTLIFTPAPNHLALAQTNAWSEHLYLEKSGSHV